MPAAIQKEAHLHVIEKNMTGSYLEMAQAVIKTEIMGLQEVMARLDSEFVKACELILACKGRVVVMGMGKSGHIANKVAATFASTGTTAFFVHPSEASHGDFGMITRDDVLLMISNSGETPEILALLPLLKRFGAPIIALTGRPESTLAKTASAHLHVGVSKEACPLGLAPTTSTTAALAMGDALAIALLDARGFTEEDFAQSHPGGQLGRRLLLRIKDVMLTGAAIPRVAPDAPLMRALEEMSQKGLGMTAIVDDQNTLLGLFTDGDLRRALDRKVDVHNTAIADVMTSKCRTITADTLAVEALNQMEKMKFNGFLVVDAEKKVIGALNMHQLLHAGVI